MDNVRGKHAITNLLGELWGTLKHTDYRALLPLDFVVDDASVLQPDLSVSNRLNLKRSMRNDDYPAGIPDVAIILHSLYARREETRQQILTYLRHGTKNVWLVHPWDKAVSVFSQGTPEPLIYCPGQFLCLPDPLPPTAIPVQDLFVWLPVECSIGPENVGY